MGMLGVFVCNVLEFFRKGDAEKQVCQWIKSMHTHLLFAFNCVSMPVNVMAL